MWYIEVLTPAVLMGACIAAVGFVNTGFQKLSNGGKLRRKCDNVFDWALLCRDKRISGRGWRTQGLEGLPDSKTS